MSLHYPRGERALTHEEAGIVDVLTHNTESKPSRVVLSTTGGQTFKGVVRSIDDFGIVNMLLDDNTAAQVCLSHISAVVQP